MGAQPQQADEYSPQVDVEFDPTPAVMGKAWGVTRAPMDGDSERIVDTHYVGDPRDIAYAFFGASAPAEFYFEHSPRTKYADELMGLLGPQMDPAPVPGAEEYINQLNAAAMQPFNTKEPKQRASNQPAASDIQANLAASPGDLLPSSESAMLALLFDA